MLLNLILNLYTMENPKDFHLPVRGPKISPIDVKNKSLDKKKLLEDAKEKVNQHKALFSISSPRFRINFSSIFYLTLKNVNLF